MLNLKPKFDFSTFQPLPKASYIELFFDLVFIYCMRCILPVLGHAEGTVGWEAYFSFLFAYLVMLQIWFCSTMLMNRYGKGGPLDILCLVVNMFMLLNMTYATVEGWGSYAVYAISWALVNVNLAVHWALRLKLTKEPSRDIVLFVQRVVVVLGVQAVIIIASIFCFDVGNHIVCLVAFLVGVLSWKTHESENLSKANAGHLVERCALLAILAFGEMIIGVAGSYNHNVDLIDEAFFLIIVLGMFLIYINQIQTIIDLKKVGNGMRYMSFTAWLTFCIGNLTAAFEMTVNEAFLGPIPSEVFFAIFMSVFLLSFFFLLPMTRDSGNVRRRWITLRALACLIPVACALVASAGSAFTSSVMTDVYDAMDYFVFYAALTVAGLATYAVLIIDRHVFKETH